MKKNDHQLIQQVLEGALPSEAFADFQERLRHEPDMVKLYGEYALLHHTLCEEFEDQPTEGISLPRSRFTPAVKVGLLAMAAVAMVLVGWVFGKSGFSGGKSRSIGNATFSADAVWDISGSADDSGGLAAGSTITLQQGQVRIDLGPDSSAVLEGPSVVKVHSVSSLHLAEGSGWFRAGVASRRLQVSTPVFTAVDLGTEFGVEAHPGRPGMLHVIGGRVELRLPRGAAASVISAGEAVGVSGEGKFERVSADPGRFLKGLQRFRPVFGGPLAKADWRIPYGSPLLAEGGISGENFSAFCKLPQPEPAEEHSVFLATLETGDPGTGDFHTDGWAGMSLFHQGVELMFFGDSFGMERTWSLDLKRRNPVILPKEKVTGPRSVTLRYDKTTGDVSLHDGKPPLQAPICQGKFPPGMVFDEIRLGASSGAALDVRSLTIQVGRP